MPTSPVQTRARKKRSVRSKDDDNNDDDAGETPPPPPPRPGSRKAEVICYTTLRPHENANGAGKSKIQVVSRRRLKEDPSNYARLQEKFDLIERDRLRKEKGEDGRGFDDESSNSAVSSMVIHINLFLYATCFFLQVGTWPHFCKKFGADPTTFDQLQTVFVVLQLIGGPIFGRFADLTGVRLPLKIAFASATISYLILGLSFNVETLLLSRLPSVFIHVMLGSQLAVANLSSESNRAVALSRLGFSFGIGMALGPVLGEYVTINYGEQSTAFTAAFGSLLSLVLLICHPPPEHNARSVRNVKRGNVFDVVPSLLLPGVGLQFLVKLLCGLPIAVIQSMFSVIATEHFGMEAEQNGLILSFIGVVSLTMQGFGIAFLLMLFSEKWLMIGSTAFLTASYVSLNQVGSVQSFLLILLLPLTSAACVVNSLLTAAVTKVAPRGQRGTVLGLNLALHSAIRCLAPILGQYLLQDYGMAALGSLGVTCNLLVMGILFLAS